MIKTTENLTILQDQRAIMADGVSLSAEVYLPVKEGVWPAILIRSPYANDLSEFQRLGLQTYVDAGLAVVYQMVRGRIPSEGKFEMFFNEEVDGAATVAWVAEQSWCNGRVAMDGGSYLGTAQYLAARAKPSQLVAIFPSVPAGDFFNEVPYIGGGFLLDHIVNWNAAQDGIDIEQREEEILELMKSVRPLVKLGEKVGITSPNFYQQLQRDTYGVRLHGLYYQPADFKNLDSLPVMTVTGWFDGDQAGSLFYWDGIERYCSRTDNKYLLIGPWDHRGCYLGGETSKGLMEFGAESVLDMLAERLGFFRAYLSEQGGPLWEIPRVRLFVTGINQWRSYFRYPPSKETLSCYLHSKGNANTSEGDGTLSLTAPEEKDSDSYTFNPADPVQYQQYGEDVSQTESRPDVLVYTTEILDEPLEIIGPIRLVLFASSDALDTDFVARLIDVFPDSTPVNLSHGRGVIRARYRNSYLQPELLEPGKIYRFEIRMNDLGHVIQSGHRLRLEVTSSMFPLVDPNPNTGTDVATETRLQIARQSIFHGGDTSSHLVLPIVGDTVI